jgi:hypothetical protein
MGLKKMGHHNKMIIFSVLIMVMILVYVFLVILFGELGRSFFLKTLLDDDGMSLFVQNKDANKTHPQILFRIHRLS